MNSAKSTVIGWGSLLVAAGASFYFAKKSINERRREQELQGVRPSEKRDWRSKIAPAEQAVVTTAPPAGGVAPTQASGSEAVSSSVAGPGGGES